ncbi:MAG: TonB-dependent receptor [Haliea sp.]
MRDTATKHQGLPRKLLFSAVSLSLMATMGASAQEGGRLEEVMVTAQKRQESIQDVPIAVTAITGDVIASQNITSLTGMNNSLPNVQINTFSNSPDSAVFSIRGVGVNDADPYVGTTVSVVVDGVVVGVNTAALLSLFDIERVEILRGPQGTLFGANTTGGVINVMTKQPTGEHGGEAQVVAGNYGRMDVNLAYNFPITDSVAGKVSMLHTSHDGYFKNLLDGQDLGSQDVTSLRGYLKYDRDNYDATLIGEYVRTRNGAQTNLNISDETQVLFVPGETGGEPRFERGQSAGLPDQNHRDTYSLTLTQNLDTSIGDWVSITNYREYDHDLFSDDDATTLQLLQTRRNIEHWQFSQELRNSFDISDRLRMVAGGFFLAQEYDLDQGGTLDGFAPGLGQPQTQSQENWTASLFAQAYYDLSDRLTLQAGLRYAHEETEAVSTTALTFTTTPGGLASFDDPQIPGSLVRAEGKDSWDEIGYKIGLDYSLDDNTMVYGYYARGFKSGGFVGRIAFPEDIGPFDPEYLDTIELGVKADLLDGNVRANLALFYNDYTDMQVTQNITFPSGANSATIQNAGEATSQGAELEVTSYFSDSWLVNLAVAYLDAEYDEYDTQAPNPVTGALEPVSFAGNPLTNAPRWSGNISTNYSLPVASGVADLFLQVTHSSSKVSNFTNFPQELVSEITLLNAKMSWTPANEQWTVGLYGRNLTDKEYFMQKQWFTPSFGIANMGAPREFGVDFAFNW